MGNDDVGIVTISWSEVLCLFFPDLKQEYKLFCKPKSYKMYRQTKAFILQLIMRQSLNKELGKAKEVIWDVNGRQGASFDYLNMDLRLIKEI